MKNLYPLYPEVAQRPFFDSRTIYQIIIGQASAFFLLWGIEYAFQHRYVVSFYFISVAILNFSYNRDSFENAVTKVSAYGIFFAFLFLLSMQWFLLLLSPKL